MLYITWTCNDYNVVLYILDEYNVPFITCETISEKKLKHIQIKIFHYLYICTQNSKQRHDSHVLRFTHSNKQYTNKINTAKNFEPV